MYKPLQVCIQHADMKNQKILSCVKDKHQFSKVSLVEGLKIQYPEQERWFHVTPAPLDNIETRYVDNVPSQGWTEIGGTSDGRMLFIWHPIYGGYGLAISAYLGYIAAYGPLRTIPFQFVQENSTIWLWPADQAANFPSKVAGELLEGECYLHSMAASSVGVELLQGKKRYVYCGTEIRQTSTEEQEPSSRMRAKLLNLSTLKMELASLDTRINKEYKLTGNQYPELVFLHSRAPAEFDEFVTKLPDTLSFALARKKKLFLTFELITKTEAQALQLPYTPTLVALHHTNINISQRELNYLQKGAFSLFREEEKYVIGWAQGTTPGHLVQLASVDTIEELAAEIKKLLNFNMLARLAVHPNFAMNIGFCSKAPL